MVDLIKAGNVNELVNYPRFNLEFRCFLLHYLHCIMTKLLCARLRSQKPLSKPVILINKTIDCICYKKCNTKQKKKRPGSNQTLIVRHRRPQIHWTNHTFRDLFFSSGSLSKVYAKIAQEIEQIDFCPTSPVPPWDYNNRFKKILWRCAHCSTSDVFCAFSTNRHIMINFTTWYIWK